MIKALLLIFDPIPTWEKIVRARRSLAFVLLVHVMPLLLIASVFEAYGLHTWGKWQTTVQRDHPKQFAVNETIIFEAAQLILSLATVFLGAKIVKALGETFHGRHHYQQTFTVVAYGLSPVFMLRLLDGFTSISPWVSWCIGILLAGAILYHGVPRVMQPDPPQAFGLFLMTILLLFLITGLARFVTAWYLQGRFAKLEPYISAVSQRLPF